MSEGRPKVLVIAGYDQSGGAGVLADIKTLEANGVYGYGVCTAMTYQNEREIRRIDWMPEADVLEQIDVCFASAAFDWIKMGITASMSSAAAIIRHVRKCNPRARVVLDPVIKASSGATFWAGVVEAAGHGAVGGGALSGAGHGAASGSDSVEWLAWEELVAESFVLTPNWEEVGQLDLPQGGAQSPVSGPRYPLDPG